MAIYVESPNRDFDVPTLAALGLFLSNGRCDLDDVQRTDTAITQVIGVCIYCEPNTVRLSRFSAVGERFRAESHSQLGVLARATIEVERTMSIIREGVPDVGIPQTIRVCIARQGRQDEDFVLRGDVKNNVPWAVRRYVRMYGGRGADCQCEESN